MKKYVTEFIGTFFLILTIGLTAAISTPVGVIPPIAIGFVLMAVIFAGGHISGAHYNPAVTFGVWLRGKCATADVLPYLIAQLLAAVAAATTALYLKGSPNLPTPTAGAPIPLVLVGEFLFTFALVYVILNVATAKGTANNSFYGLAIGGTVMAGAFAVGPITGGSFNPAVTLALVFFYKAIPLASLWAYLAAQIVAGLLAGALFRLQNADE
jgi:aquaporin Z